MSLKLNSSGGGSVTLQEPVTASDLTLNLPTSSGTVVLDGGSPTFSALTVNGNNISAVNSMGFRNRIINGEMTIDQRNNGASVTQNNAGIYTVDRWQAYGNVNSKFTIQQNAGSVTPPVGFTNYLGCTSTSAYTVGAGEGYVISQSIEGFNTADFGWGAAGATSVTLSFWVRSSLTGTFGGVLQNSAQNRTYPFTFTISAANTWEQKSITIAGDTTGTWLTNNGIGVRVYFSLGAGSTWSAAAGSWTSTFALSATGATSVIGTNGATFYVTGVQLEAGTVATPFERIDYGRKLLLCQRYYFQDAGAGVDGYAVNGTTLVSTYYYPVYMRTLPTITQTGSVIIVSGTADTNLNTNAAPYSSLNKQLFTINATSTGRVYLYRPAQFSAEL